MTTTVTITHDGPDGPDGPDVHDVLVTPTGSTSRQEPTRIHAGESLTVYFWGDGNYTITEVSKEQKQ